MYSFTRCENDFHVNNFSLYHKNFLLLINRPKLNRSVMADREIIKATIEYSTNNYAQQYYKGHYLESMFECHLL